MTAARLVALALLAWSSAAGAVERYAVIIGNNVGAPDEVTLRYAEQDATRVYDVLKDLGGFHPENMVLLKREEAATVRRALIAMNDRIRAGSAGSPSQAVLVVYYSGHADAAALHLGGSTLELAELEQLVRGSSSAFRLLMLDSCHSGALTRRKGGKSGPPLPIRVEERLAGEGAVVLAASAADEDAQESDDIKSSFFTHYLVSGLVGAADANDDGKVTLEEAYHYTYESTLRASSRTFAGAQHPSFRYELHGQGGLVLTSVGADRARRGLLAFPEGRSYLVMQDHADGAVVAEVGIGDRARRVDVRSGRYFVRGRGRDHLLEGTVSVAAGETHAVSDGELRRLEYARLVRKGGTPLRLVHGPQAGYRVRTGLTSGSSLCHGFFAGWNVELKHLSIAPRVAYCRSSLDNATLRADSDAFDLELALAHAFDIPYMTFEFGVAVGAALISQQFTTAGIAPPRTAGAFQLSATAALSTDLPHGLYVFCLVAGETYFFDQVARDGTTHFGPAFTVATSLGLGRRW
jgi:Caspase domain